MRWYMQICNGIISKNGIFEAKPNDHRATSGVHAAFKLSGARARAPAYAHIIPKKKRNKMAPAANSSTLLNGKIWHQYVTGSAGGIEKVKIDQV